MDNTNIWWISIGILIFLVLLISLVIKRDSTHECIGKSIYEATYILSKKSIKLRNKVGSVPPPDNRFQLLGTISSLVKTNSPSEYDYILYQLDVPSLTPYEPQTIQSMFEPDLKALQELQQTITKQVHEEQTQQMLEYEEMIRQEQLHKARIEQELFMQQEWAKQDKLLEEQAKLKEEQEKIKNNKKNNMFGVDIPRERSVKKTQKTSFGW